MTDTVHVSREALAAVLAMRAVAMHNPCTHAWECDTGPEVAALADALSASETAELDPEAPEVQDAPSRPSWTPHGLIRDQDPRCPSCGWRHPTPPCSATIERNGGWKPAGTTSDGAYVYVADDGERLITHIGPTPVSRETDHQ